MSRKYLEEHLQDYYQGQSLSGKELKRLTMMARTSSPGKEYSMAQLLMAWWPRTLAGFVAGAFVALIGVSIFLQQTEDGPQGFPSLPNDIHSQQVLNTSLDATPGIVAVQIHADWCRRSPLVASHFKELTSKYGNQPILFVTLDITDETKRKQARLLAKNLGIEHVFDKPFESGMIKLLNRKQPDVLMVFTEEEQRPGMEILLAQALDLH